MNTVFIYALKEPDTGRIRYIGKTSDPGFRLRRHIAQARKGLEKYRKVRWIRSLLDRGIEPAMEMIDETSESEWPMLEAAYIQFYRDEGCDLVNSTCGGEGFGAVNHNFRRNFSLETRQKISLAGKGRKHSLETRKKMSASRLGKRLTEDWRKNIGDGHRGKRLSLEHRQKLSVAHIGNKPSLETRKKMSISHGGSGQL